MGKVCRDIAEEETIDNQRLASKHYFDNDLENYPISQGDLMNIRTEKDYSKYIHIIPPHLIGRIGGYELSRQEEEIRFSVFFTFLIELDPFLNIFFSI